MYGDSPATKLLPGGPSAGGCAPQGARDLARFLYNHNPFYMISAALVLYGLRMSFLGGDAFQTRAMIVGLMAFSLLLAAVAALISLLKTGLPQGLWSRYKLVMARMIRGGRDGA
jgi:hypothetical protein